MLWLGTTTNFNLPSMVCAPNLSLVFNVLQCYSELCQVCGTLTQSGTWTMICLLVQFSLTLSYTQLNGIHVWVSPGVLTPLCRIVFLISSFSTVSWFQYIHQFLTDYKGPLWSPSFLSSRQSAVALFVLHALHFWDCTYVWGQVERGHGGKKKQWWFTLHSWGPNPTD